MSKKLKLMGFYEDLHDLLETNEKGWPFHHREFEFKSRKSRDTGSNRQVWLWKSETGPRLIEFCQENTLVITNTLF